MVDIDKLEKLKEKADPTPYERWKGQYSVYAGVLENKIGSIKSKNGMIFEIDPDFTNQTKKQCDSNIKFITEACNQAQPMIDEIRRLRELTEWQDIGTAPKDGSRFWYYSSKTGRRGTTKWSVNSKKWSVESKPTHWMPLPERPKELNLMTDEIQQLQSSLKEMHLAYDRLIELNPLYQLMSEISEECYCATWMSGLEFDLWHAVINGPKHYGQGDIRQEQIKELKDLSQKYNGWIMWKDSLNTTVFVSMGEWERTKPNEPEIGHLYSAFRSNFGES